MVPQRGCRANPVERPSLPELLRDGRAGAVWQPLTPTECQASFAKTQLLLSSIGYDVWSVLGKVQTLLT